MGLLALAFVVVVVGYAVERNRSQVLTLEVAALEAQLTTARARLQAYQSRIDHVRDAVGELSEHVAGLQSMVQKPIEVSSAPGGEASATP